MPAFGTWPSPYKQYFIIHGKYRERFLPFATSLLNGKNNWTLSPITVLKREIRLNRAVCHFEQAVISPVETKLPTATVTVIYTFARPFEAVAGVITPDYRILT